MSNNLTVVEIVPVINDLNTKLAGQNGDQVFEALKRVLRGEEPYPIDFNSIPYTPDRWEVLPDSEQLPNRMKGVMEFDPTKVDFYFDEGQKNGNVINGTELRKNLSGVVVYGAQLLDFLLKKENQHLIPKKWKGKAVFFWGTIYRGSDRGLYVRYLYWDGNGWDWGYRWLNGDWDSFRPALVPASKN